MSLQSNSPDEDASESDRIVRSLTAPSDGSDEVTTSNEPGDVLSAIADRDCREILAATAEESVSVSDLVEQCDISTATAYRKVDRLVNAGLLHERIQIRPYGRNECEYSLRIKTIHIKLTESGIPEARVSLTPGSDNPYGHAITDGGTVRDEDEPSHDRLGSIFVDVTGTEKVVNKQESGSPERQLSADDEQSVSEYVSAVAKDDGLADSLPEPKSPGGN